MECPGLRSYRGLRRGALPSCKGSNWHILRRNLGTSPVALTKANFINEMMNVFALFWTVVASALTVTGVAHVDPRHHFPPTFWKTSPATSSPSSITHDPTDIKTNFPLRSLIYISNLNLHPMLPVFPDTIDTEHRKEICDWGVRNRIQYSDHWYYLTGSMHLPDQHSGTCRNCQCDRLECGYVKRPTCCQRLLWDPGVVLEFTRGTKNGTSSHKIPFANRQRVHPCRYTLLKP